VHSADHEAEVAVGGGGDGRGRAGGVEQPQRLGDVGPGLGKRLVEDREAGDRLGGREGGSVVDRGGVGKSRGGSVVEGVHKVAACQLSSA
jgi:hypothetical protein